MCIAVPQPRAWETLLQSKTGYICITAQLCRPMKLLMLRGGLVGYCFSLNRYVLVLCRISTACPVQAGWRYGQWYVNLHCSKPMSCAGGGGVYPGFWLVLVLAVVIYLVSLKGKSIFLPLVWDVLSW